MDFPMNFSMNFSWPRLLLPVLALALVACDSGGGGGGGGNDNPSGHLSVDVSAMAITGYAPSPTPDTTTVTRDITVKFKGPGVAVGLTTSTSSPWISVSTLSESKGTAVFRVTLSLPAPAYSISYPYHENTALRFLTGNVSGSSTKYIDVPISAHIYAPLMMSPGPAVIPGVEGDETASRQFTLPATGFSWEIINTPEWLEVSPASGTDSTVVNFTCNLALLTAPIAASSTFTLRNLTGNVDREVPVTCASDTHRLLASRRAIGLSKFADASRLTDSIVVGHNGQGDAEWQATSDADWLTVTPSGSTGDTLTVSADPATLADGEIHYATVSLSLPEGASHAPPEVIQVALYKSAGNLPTGRVAYSEYLWGVMDPLRPFLYRQPTFLGAITKLNIYDLSESVYYNPAGRCLEIGDASDDGRYLYVVSTPCSTGSPGSDKPYGSKPYEIRQLDLMTGADTLIYQTTIEPFTSYPRPLPLVHLRQNGTRMLSLLGAGLIISATDGAVRVNLHPASGTPGTAIPNSYFPWGLDSSGTSNDDGTLFVRNGYMSVYEHIYSMTDVVSMPEIAPKITAQFVSRAKFQYEYAMGISPDSDRFYTDAGIYQKVGSVWQLSSTYTIVPAHLLHSGGRDITLLPLPGNRFFSDEQTVLEGVAGIYDHELTLIDNLQDDSGETSLSNCHISADRLVATCNAPSAGPAPTASKTAYVRLPDL